MPTGTPAAHASAVGTIKNLASVPEVQNYLVEEGAVLNVPLSLYTCDALQSLATTEEITRQTIIREASETSIDELRSIGLLSRLIFALRNGLLTEQQFAALVVCHLASSTEPYKLLGSIGCIPPFVCCWKKKATSTHCWEVYTSVLFHFMS
ncbi:hypothetical protein KP509_30G039900 [Ceratopteris richardii]|uniref:Uncharacterized protein n=1 Tax=Ceratopteris richardii TaxID=49495 RepID=A0A8T2R2S7_CERRI|nr:hypothetical protein KP509_30G039900 [Ceratopteris richardii]